jgi:tRNA (uracil-5-)-methyltransferase TRM9
MGVKATQPEGPSSEDGLDGGNGKGTEGEERIEYKIQDVLVPWVLRSKPKPKPKPKSKPKSKSGLKSKTPASLDSKPNENEDEHTTSDQVDEKNGTGPQKEEAEEEAQNGEKEEEEQVFNRYYHLFIEGELRDLIHQAGREEGYRILPLSSPSSSSSSTSPLVSSTSTSTPSTSSTTNDEKVIKEGSGDGKWLRIRGEGWEADNWWVEAEVGVGDGQ